MSATPYADALKDARMDKAMSCDLDESKQWCCPNCGQAWKVFNGKQYPFCGCSVVAGPGTIRFDPVECEKLKAKEK